MKSILAFIGLAIFSAFFSLLLVILVTSKNGVFFGVRSFVVMSGSMEPSLPVGSLIFSIPAKTYSQGDVISFNKNSLIVTHRIQSIVFDSRQTKFVTKGDANNIADSGYVNADQIIGKKVLYLPFIGKLIVFVKTIPGFLLFFITPALIFILLELRSIKIEVENQFHKKIAEARSRQYSRLGFEML